MVALGLLTVPIPTAGPASAQEFPWPPVAPTHYVKMSDGTEIALNIRMRVPSQETLLHDAEHRSRIMLPIVPLRGVTLGPELSCGQQTAVRCVGG